MFNKKPKEYKCTSKIKFAFQKSIAMGDLAEMYINHDNHHRAKEAVIERQVQFDKAWKLVFELYPELTGKRLTHELSNNTVHIRED